MKDSLTRLIGSEYSRPRNKRPRLTKDQKNKIAALALQKVTPTFEEVLKSMQCDKEKARQILNSILAKRRVIASKLKCSQDELSIPGIRSKTEGHVYLVVNVNFTGWVKGGMTRNLKQRIASYNLYDPTKNFKCLVHKAVANVRQTEALLLAALKKEAEHFNGEWFKIEESKALRIFSDIQ